MAASYPGFKTILCPKGFLLNDWCADAVNGLVCFPLDVFYKMSHLLLIKKMC